MHRNMLSKCALGCIGAQVYQIATNLATENDNAMAELGESRLEAEHLKEQLVERDAQIVDLEARANGRMLANQVEFDARMEGYGDMATPRSTASLGARPRSALPRPPSRSSVMTPTPRGPTQDVMAAHIPPHDTPSPRSVSQIPRAPDSDTETSHVGPLLTESLDGQPSVSGAAASEAQPRGTSPAPAKAEYTSRTSMKRMPPGAPRRR